MESLDLAPGLRPYSIRSVVITWVKILPDRPPAWLIGAKYIIMKSVLCSLHYTLSLYFTRSAACSLCFTLTIFNLITSKMEVKSERLCTLLNCTGNQRIYDDTVISMTFS